MIYDVARNVFLFQAGSAEVSRLDRCSQFLQDFQSADERRERALAGEREREGGGERERGEATICVGQCKMHKGLLHSVSDHVMYTTTDGEECVIHA